MSTLIKPTINSNISRTTAKDERPHRRLSLTRPTLPVAGAVEETTEPPHAGSTPSVESASIKSSVKKKRASKETPIETDGPTDSAAPVVRVMAYLSAAEATLLDDLWIQYRRSPQKPSKSDILRAALILASNRKEELTVTLSQQHTNTLSRQRSSKIKIADSDA